MSDQVGNPEDRFSQNEAHLSYNICHIFSDFAIKRNFLPLVNVTLLRMLLHTYIVNTDGVSIICILNPLLDYRFFKMLGFVTHSDMTPYDEKCYEESMKIIPKLSEDI